MAKAKCGYCNKEIIDKTNCTKKGSRWYHNECLLQMEKEKSYWSKIMDVINYLYGGNEQIPYLSRQLKNLKDNYKFNDKGIYSTLLYYFKICKNDFNEEYGLIWIIEKYYYEARDFFIQKKKINELSKKIDFEEELVVIENRGNRYIPNDKLEDVL